MTGNEDKRLTYISKDGLVCYKDHKSPNVISTYDIKATHSLDEACTIIDILLGKLADYEAIGTIEEFKALKEKSEPKKPISLDKRGEYWKCPTCGKYAVNNFGCKYKFCPNCGTGFEWQ